jgi:small neutral amino acid transporter SnatA (MarC family)
MGKINRFFTIILGVLYAIIACQFIYAGIDAIGNFG